MSTDNEGPAETPNRITLDTDLSTWSDEDLVSLTTEEIARWIDIESAKSGVEFLPEEPGPKPEVTTPEVDEEVFVVKLGNDTFPLRTMEAAETFITAIATVRTEMISLGGSRYDKPQYIREKKDADPPTIETVWAISAAVWKQSEAAHENQEEALSEWEEKREAYDRVVGERVAIDQEIEGKLREAQERINARVRAQVEFDRYLGLSEGDRATALRFLGNVRREAIDTLGLEDEYAKATEPGQDAVHLRATRGAIEKIRGATEGEDEALLDEEPVEIEL